MYMDIDGSQKARWGFTSDRVFNINDPASYPTTLSLAIGTAKDIEGHLQGGRAQHKEWVCAGFDRAVHHDRGLPGIIQQQGRQHQAIPGESDRPRAEVTHIGVQRLRSSRAQEYSAQH